jgi:hypothetical protein
VAGPTQPKQESGRHAAGLMTQPTDNTQWASGGGRLRRLRAVATTEGGGRRRQFARYVCVRDMGERERESGEVKYLGTFSGT